jgi:hypothetical protein
MNRFTVNQDIVARLQRIHRLSEKPPNPGYAYRHLEHIHALCELMLKDLTGKKPEALSKRPVYEPLLAPARSSVLEGPLHPQAMSALVALSQSFSFEAASNDTRERCDSEGPDSGCPAES